MVITGVDLHQFHTQPDRCFMNPFTNTLKHSLRTTKPVQQYLFPSLISSLFLRPPHPLHPSLMPRTKLGLQFNSPSAARLKYYPRNEIRDPEYREREWQRELDTDMAWFRGLEARPSVGRRPGSPPKVAKYLPSLLGWLDMSTQPPCSLPMTPLFCSGPTGVGTVSQAGCQTHDKKFLLTAGGHGSSPTWEEWASHF